MLDEFERLRIDPFLLKLLGHYARLAEPDREVWQDRLMTLDGVEASEMTKLHGDLLTFGWIEWGQNGKRPSACYRVTCDGLRAFRFAGEGTATDPAACTIESPIPITSKRKRGKKPALELVAADA
jgi:hypothetical protein